MELQKALEYVNQLENGKCSRLDWNEWSNIEITLRGAGQDKQAEMAHRETIRAYHKEEWDADLL